MIEPVRFRSKYSKRVTKLREITVFALLIIAITGCNRLSSPEPVFQIESCTPLSNFQPERKEKDILLDYAYALDSGFVIPSAAQTETGRFAFRFDVVNRGDRPERLFYKIYYQNETYKYPVTGSGEQAQALAAENFYGSWEDAGTGFVDAGLIANDGTPHRIEDAFRIVGNPRDEKRYYGPPRRDRGISAEAVDGLIKYIRSDEKWSETIRQKALANGVTFEVQLRNDAMYVLASAIPDTTLNNRWKRNPRVGTYSFLLVVTTAGDLARIPQAVQYINHWQNGQFVNPYAWFLGGGHGLEHTVALVSATTLRVKARPALGNGIYINPQQLRKRGVDYTTDCMDARCNDGGGLFDRAAFEQFFHHTQEAMSFRNVPMTADLLSDGYTQAVYDSLSRLPAESRVDAAIANAECPCRSVGVDTATGELLLRTLPPPPGKWQKLNTGLASRNGFTYGKYTARIRFPHLLNRHNMWNGLTNAFWMIDESNEEWNRLRPCEEAGYIPKELSGKDAPRTRFTSYSEIDIEIRKASARWPVTSYNKADVRPAADQGDSGRIVVTCTNWDLACPDPVRYDAGTQHTSLNGIDFLFHRWDHYYQAITTKYVMDDADLFGRDYYYYQIDWRPDSIIWRIGPERDRLVEIGFLDRTVSSIPDNQMVMVFTQEFHPSAWWPESPQLLELIPFPASEITGRIMDVEIE